MHAGRCSIEVIVLCSSWVRQLALSRTWSCDWTATLRPVLRGHCRNCPLHSVLLNQPILKVCTVLYCGFGHFTVAVSVQLIAWEDRPWNDLLRVERDVKHLFTHSLDVYDALLLEIRCHLLMFCTYPVQHVNEPNCIWYLLWNIVAVLALWCQKWLANLGRDHILVTNYYCYYYHIHLMAFFQDNLDKPAPER